MEITLEKIELVKDRTGVGYKEAKEALEQSNGSVVDAIILIEEKIDSEEPKVRATATEATTDALTSIIAAIKDAIHKGNVSKIVIKKEDEVILNLPLNIGLIGTVLFPWASVVGVIAAFGSKCSIQLIKDDGDVVDISTKAAETFETAKDKGGVIFDEVIDKSEEFVATAKEKGLDVIDQVAEKSSDAFETVKEKAAGVISKDSDVNFGDFDLSDLDLSAMGESMDDAEDEPKEE